MRRFIIFILFLILPSVVLSVSKNPLTPSSKITAVTVYEDRAMVTRTAHLTLEAKEYQVEVQDLPAGIFEESVRASGRGQARVTITGLETQKTFLEKTGEARVRELEDQIQQFEDEKRRIQDQIAARKNQQKFLSSIQVLSTDQISKELSTKRPNVAEYQQVLSFLYTNSANVNLEIQKLEVSQRELQRKLSVLQRELQQIRSTRGRTRNSAIVSLQADRGGDFNLEVSYVVRGASWRPSYDARVVEKPHKIELRYYGEVSQRTGEDWPEADIILSTARPAIGGRAPELDQWVLGFVPPPVYGLDEKDVRGGRVGARKPSIEAPKERSVERFEEVLEAEFATSQIRAAGTSVLFEIDEKKEVPSDGSPHKFTVAINKFTPEMNYEAVPKLSSYAYLHCSVKNEVEYPLLAGAVSIFMGPDFIGKSRIDNIAPTEEFPLYLGVDEGIKIKRDLVKKEKSKRGFLTKKEKVYYHYKTTITSYKSDKVSLRLKDQLPISQDKEIVVTDVKIIPKPKEHKQEEGEILWDLELSPKEKREISLEFSVEYPLGKEVFGLF
jgi:uncharacterized protein (TIGR02231 family)